MLEVVRAVPELADLLQRPFDADRAAAEHHRLFGLEVHPYASVFLEPDARVGGNTTDAVARLGASAGWVPSGTGTEVDHVAEELALAGHLTRHGRADLLLRLFGEHVLWWLPSFAHAAIRHADAFWARVLTLTLAVVTDHATDLGVGRDEGRTGRGDPSPEPPPALVEDPRSPWDGDADLKALATWLTSPVRSGVYLALADIRDLGRAHDLPGGFGSRVLVLENLLRSAVHYESLGGVADGLAELGRGTAVFLQWEVSGRFSAPWTARVGVLEEVLGRLVEGEGV